MTALSPEQTAAVPLTSAVGEMPTAITIEIVFVQPLSSETDMSYGPEASPV